MVTRGLAARAETAVAAAALLIVSVPAVADSAALDSMLDKTALKLAQLAYATVVMAEPTPGVVVVEQVVGVQLATAVAETVVAA
jgi:hypothetical protein